MQSTNSSRKKLKDVGGLVARINIEDKLFSDSRFIRLVELLGNYHLAIGLVVEVIRVGQKFWTDGRLIPVKIFMKIPNAKFHIECGLSNRRKSGIYVCGSDEHFAWISKFRDLSRKRWKSKDYSDAYGMRGNAYRIPPTPTPVIEKKNAAVDSITPRRLTRREIEEQKNELLRRAEIWNREQSGQLSGLPSDPELPKNSKK